MRRLLLPRGLSRDCSRGTLRWCGAHRRLRSRARSWDVALACNRLQKRHRRALWLLRYDERAGFETEPQILVEGEPQAAQPQRRLNEVPRTHFPFVVSASYDLACTRGRKLRVRGVAVTRRLES